MSPRSAILAAASAGAALVIALAVAVPAVALPTSITRFRALAPQPVAVGPTPGRQALLAADFNGDGRADLAAITPSPGGGDSWVDIYRNQGDGTLVYDDSLYTSPGAPSAVALADITSPPDATHGHGPDGVSDLLIGDRSGALTVRHGRANGDFELTAQVIDVSLAIRGIASGHFDARPGLDVAVIDADNVWLLCNADGQLVPCATGAPLAPGIGDLIEIVGGDFDGDAHADLAVLSGAEQRVVVLYGAGDGTFEVGAPISVAVEASGGGPAVDLAVAWIDGDSYDDLVVANFDELGFELGATLYGSRTRTPRLEPFVLELGTTALALADFDQPRGTLDAIGGTADGRLTVNLNDGSGFSDQFLFSVLIRDAQLGSVGALAVADLDGDGWPDLLSLNAQGDAVVPLLNLNGPGCPGDCGRDNVVTVDDLTRAVAILLGEQPLGVCPSLDRDQNGNATIAEVITGVRALLEGCSVFRSA